MKTFKDTLKNLLLWELGGIVFIVMAFLSFTAMGEVEFSTKNIIQIFYNWFIGLWVMHLIFIVLSFLGVSTKSLFDKIDDSRDEPNIRL